MGIFFAVLAPAIYAINNFFDKFFLEKYKISPSVMSIINGISGFISGLIVLFFTGFYIASLNSIAIIIISGFLMIGCVLFYYKALFTDDTSRVMPLVQLVPVFVLILSFIFLGEKLFPKQYLGSFIIIVSTFFISLEKFDLKIFKVRPAFWYMLGYAFLYASSLVLYKFGVENISFWHTLPYEGLGMAFGALAIYLYGNNKKTFLREAKQFKGKGYFLLSLNESVFVSARYVTYFALSLISASIVNILLGLHPLFVLLLGVVLSVWFPKILKEVINKKVLFQKIISIVFIFIGLYLIFSKQ